LLFSQSASAKAPFDVNITSITNSIYPNLVDSAKFTIYTINNQEKNDTFKIILPADIRWNIFLFPITDASGFNLAPNNAKQSIVEIRTTKRIPYGQYVLPIKIHSKNTNITFEKKVIFFVKDPEKMFMGYEPRISIDIDISKNIDPRKPEHIRISMLNLNRLNITEMDIILSSRLLNKEFKKTTSLGPLKRADVEFNIKYDDMQKPANDTLKLKFYLPKQNITYDTLTRKIRILPYVDIRQEKEEKKGFLKTTTKYTFTNKGNIATEKEFRIKTSLLKSVFTSTKPKQKSIKNQEGRFYIFKIKLKQDQTESITITTNYRMLFFMLIAAIGAIVLYYIFRSPVVIKKEFIKMRAKENDEGFSRAKILILIKNRSSKEISNIRIIDRVPSLANVDKNFGIGTIPPEKIIRHEKKGIILRWEIGSLEPYEERIISYQITTKMEIIGNLKLSSALAKFKNKRGRIIRVYSNTPAIYAKE